MLPEGLKPVLAKITHQGSLGVSDWHEVVYFNGEAGIGEWESYSGSKTFLDGEKVIACRYVDDIELMGV